MYRDIEKAKYFTEYQEQRRQEATQGLAVDDAR